MKRFSRTLLIVTAALAAIILPLVTSYEIREWAGNTFLPAGVVDQPLVSPPTPVSFDGPVLRFLAVGDAGTGGQGQREVAEGMGRVAAMDSTSFVLFLGDNFYERGVESVTDPQWQEKFETMYHHPGLQIPFIAILGNHDHVGNPDAQVEYTTTRTRWFMPARFYSHIVAIDESTNVQFFLLDTNPLADLTSEDMADGKDSADWKPQIRWLEEQLGRSTAQWKFVVGHHTMYSNGEHGNNPRLASILEPLMIRHGVHFYIAGHDHNLELLEPIRGITHVISGAGGKDRDVTWAENTVFAATRLGFVRFSVTPSAVGVEFFNRAGELAYAHVTTAPFLHDTP